MIPVVPPATQKLLLKHDVSSEKPGAAVDLRHAARPPVGFAEAYTEPFIDQAKQMPVGAQPTSSISLPGASSVLCQVDGPPPGSVVHKSVPSLPPAMQRPLRGQAKRPRTGSESTVRGEDHDHAARSPDACVVVTGVVVDVLVVGATEVCAGAVVEELPVPVPLVEAQPANDRPSIATVAASSDRECEATAGQR